MQSTWGIQSKFVDVSEFFLVQAEEGPLNDNEDTPKSKPQTEYIQIEEVSSADKGNSPIPEEAFRWNPDTKQAAEPHDAEEPQAQQNLEEDEPTQQPTSSRQAEELTPPNSESLVYSELMLPTENTELMDSLPQRGQSTERKMSLHEFIAAEEMMRALQGEPLHFARLNPEAIPRELRNELDGMCQVATQPFGCDPNSPLGRFWRETRQDKLNRFLRKRQLRNWGKKINYLCRKQVADSRLRIKGRFVTREQANTILGRDVSQLPVEQIRALLHAKLSQKGGEFSLSDPPILTSMHF